MKRIVSAIELMCLYVEKHPGCRAKDLWRDLPREAFPCGFEDVEVGLRILSVMRGGIDERKGRYYPSADTAGAARG